MKGPVALVDCNNFYASCERVFNPQVAHKPVVVLSNNDGMVIARSQEAKDIGIKMGMPYFEARPLAKKYDLQIFSSNYALYGDMSNRVMTTLEQFSPNVEIYSIDEAFMNFEGFERKNLEEYCRLIRRTVIKWTGIPVSIGLAPTKTLAKVANKHAKKHKKFEGVLSFLNNPEVDSWLEATDVADIWGIGHQYTKLLNRHGIYNAYELSKANDKWVKKHMTVMGLRTVLELRGIPCITMEYDIPAKKAIVSSRSFGHGVKSKNDVSEAVASYTTRAAEKMRLQKSACRSLTVFLRTNPYKDDLPQYHNGCLVELPVPANSTPELLHYAQRGVNQIYREGYEYHKVGVMLTDFVPFDSSQISMFDTKDRLRMARITELVDKVNNVMGKGTLMYAAEGIKKEWAMKRNMKSPHYTTQWQDLPVVSAGWFPPQMSLFPEQLRLFHYG